MKLLAVLLLLLAPASLPGCGGPEPAAWDALLRTWVNAESRVDYAAWRQSGKPALDQYLRAAAAPWPSNLSPNCRKAALINAYNALTISWVLAHYPVESIWRTKKPFSAARHVVNGATVSLDAIETELRASGDPRIHAALVCAARGCPPLRREAYAEPALDRQLDETSRAWLAAPRQYEYNAAADSAKVSEIFHWYRTDFEKSGGGVWSFLAKFSPAGSPRPSAKTSIRHYPWHWGLNDASSLGAKYSRASFLWDYARHK